MKKAKWIVVISILMVLFAQQVCANGFVGLFPKQQTRK